MKSKIIFTTVFAFIFAVAAVAAQAQQVFFASLSGRQVVPANNSTSSAFCKLTPNAAETGVSMTCDYSLSSPGVNMSLYVDTPVGQNGTPLFTTPLQGQTGGFSSALGGFGPQQIANLRANRWYIQFTSADFPTGDVRGQFKLANGTYNDYDADGRADLVVYRAGDLSFYARGSLDASLLTGQVGQAGDSVSLNVDFDGDAKSDFSTAQYSSQVIWRILQSRNGALQQTNWGSSTLGDFFAAGDYDGDGASDIAVFRAGDWYIIQSSDQTVRYDHFGQSGDIPTPNDYDKDGKAELAVARSEGGLRYWYRLNSSNGQFVATQFGLSSDAFFAGRADYDGDGAADISVIRNISGTRNFYILRSSDQQFQGIQFGLSSDLPKLADYDGDGKTDLAVTRNVSGAKAWYILQSSDGQVRYDSWGLPGDF
jgi:hypothetical protein